MTTNLLPLQAVRLHHYILLQKRGNLLQNRLR